MDKEDIINAHFTGELNEGQQQEFDKLMSEDAGFAQEVTFRAKVRQAIHLEERNSLKSQLRYFEAEEKLQNKGWNIGRWIAAAAAVLIVGIAVTWWYNQRASQRLYLSYFETFPNMVQPLVRGENKYDKSAEAFLSYDKGDYQKSAALFAEAGGATSLFYAALSEMELGRHEKALILFEKIDPGATQLGRYVLWYKALNFLKLGRETDAQAILSQLEKEKDFELADKVSELKNKLDP